MKKMLLVVVAILFGAGMASAFPVLHMPKSALEKVAVTRTGLSAVPAPAGACGSSAHCSLLTWTESSPGTITYNIFKGTTSGGEGTTPINSAPLSVLSYTDPVTLTASAQTFFYEVQASETSGGITQTATSAEVSVTFPAILNAPAASATTQ